MTEENLKKSTNINCNENAAQEGQHLIVAQNVKELISVSVPTKTQNKKFVLETRNSSRGNEQPIKFQLVACCSHQTLSFGELHHRDLLHAHRLFNDARQSVWTHLKEKNFACIYFTVNNRFALLTTFGVWCHINFQEN